MSTNDGKTAFIEKETLFAEDGKPETLRIKWGNGVERRYDLTRMPEKIRYEAEGHGYSQKLGDISARFSKERNFAGAVETTDASYNSMLAGAWNLKGGSTGPRVSDEDLIRGLREILKISENEAKAVLVAADEATRRLMIKDDAMAAKLAAYAAERAKAAAAKSGPTGLAAIIASLKG